MKTLQICPRHLSDVATLPWEIQTSHCSTLLFMGGSVAEWLACWTQVEKARVQIAVATLSGNSLRQTVHTRCVNVAGTLRRLILIELFKK